MFEEKKYSPRSAAEEEVPPVVSEFHDAHEDSLPDVSGDDTPADSIENLSLADQLNSEFAMAELKERYFSVRRATSVEDEENKEGRQEREISVRNLFLKMSSENPFRRPTKEVSPGNGRDALFEGREPVWEDTFTVGENDVVAVTESIYVIDDVLHSRISITNESGDRIYIDNLLPDGVRILPGAVEQLSMDKLNDPSRAYADFIAKQKYAEFHQDDFFYYFEKGDGRDTRGISYGNIRTPEGIFSILHEIGHAWNDTAGLPGTFSGGENLKHLTQVHKLSDRFFGTKYERTALENNMKEERDANAHALRVIRVLRDQGFQTTEVLRAARGWVKSCLDSYQQVREGWGSIQKLNPGMSYVSGKRRDA